MQPAGAGAGAHQPTLWGLTPESSLVPQSHPAVTDHVRSGAQRGSKEGRPSQREAGRPAGSPAGASLSGNYKRSERPGQQLEAPTGQKESAAPKTPGRELWGLMGKTRKEETGARHAHRPRTGNVASGPLKMQREG